MSLCLVAIFKNESYILEEYINHYIRQGVDKIFFIDNGSDDDYLIKLQPFIDNNYVELVIDNRRHVQTDCYNKYYLEKCKNYDWVILCDLDEFIYARRGFTTIKQYLTLLTLLDHSISCVYIPWKMFSSNGLKEQPTSVIKSFTKRTNYDKNEGFQCIEIHNGLKYGLMKSIIRTKYLVRFDIHYHITSDNNNMTSNNVKRLEGEPVHFCIIDENILNHSYLHLNHYAIQSYDWFMKIKKTRGDVSNQDVEYIRDEKYFHDYDKSSNDIDDFELCNLYN
jgi:hypothetical protein